MVKRYFDEHHIPYSMEHGIPMRTDLPEVMEMTCTKCHKTHSMPYDTYMDLLEQYDPFEEEEFLVIECIYCHNGDMLPTKYINQKVKLKKL